MKNIFDNIRKCYFNGQKLIVDYNLEQNPFAKQNIDKKLAANLEKLEQQLEILQNIIENS